MAWLVRDENVDVCYILDAKPIRKDSHWDFSKKDETNLNTFEVVHVNKIKHFFGIIPKWEDEPLEIVIKEK